MARKRLILGGIRSGKSAYAEVLAHAGHLPVCYVATAVIEDEEMAQRIQSHQQRRPNEWLLLETPINLVDVFSQTELAHYCLLVDCLSVWLSNVLCAQPETIEQQIEHLCRTIESTQQDIILVSSEVGMSLVSTNALGRRYSDFLGKLNQQLAQVCDDVIMVVAGLPMVLKGDVT